MEARPEERDTGSVASGRRISGNNWDSGNDRAGGRDRERRGPVRHARARARRGPGPPLAPGSTIARIDDLAPLLPIVRSSPAALLVISDTRPLRLAIPTFAVARVAWRARFGRTTGWTSLVAERALFHFAALGAESHDLGMQSALLEKTG